MPWWSTAWQYRSFLSWSESNRLFGNLLHVMGCTVDGYPAEAFMSGQWACLESLCHDGWTIQLPRGTLGNHRANTWATDPGSNQFLHRRRRIRSHSDNLGTGCNEPWKTTIRRLWLTGTKWRTSTISSPVGEEYNKEIPPVPEAQIENRCEGWIYPLRNTLRSYQTCDWATIQMYRCLSFLWVKSLSCGNLTLSK